MQPLVELLASGVWSLLSLADKKLTAYHQKRRLHGRKPPTPEQREARIRLARALNLARKRPRTIHMQAHGPSFREAALMPPRAKTVLAAGMWDGILSK